MKNEKAAGTLLSLPAAFFGLLLNYPYTICFTLALKTYACRVSHDTNSACAK